MKKPSAGPAGLNLANLTADARNLIEADKTACFIRMRCKGLGLAERRKRGQEMLSNVPEHLRAAVIEQLRLRASE